MTSVLVPAPPATLAAPNRSVVPAGTTLHRLHLSTYAGDAFNPCGGRPTRFAPITDMSGQCVPSLCAGSSLEAAIFETVFHDIDPKATFKTVPKPHVAAKSHSVLRVTRDLTFVELRAPDLKKLGLVPGDVVSAPASRYPGTALWAKAFHDQFADVQGLRWTSNQCDPDSACLMFGDRVAPADIVLVSTRDASVDVDLIEDIRRAGQRAGITLTL